VAKVTKLVLSIKWKDREARERFNKILTTEDTEGTEKKGRRGVYGTIPSLRLVSVPSNFYLGVKQEKPYSLLQFKVIV
jgi:hypothetical protein